MADRSQEGSNVLKTLVAQVWDNPETFSTYQGAEAPVETFWKPCIESVKKWSQQNGYDYRSYSTKECFEDLPDLEPLVQRSTKPNGVSVITPWHRSCIGKLAMLNNPSYDRVLILDADIFVWGNPALSEAPLSIYVGKRRIYGDHYQIFYPQGGAYSTTQHLEMYNWACRNIEGDEDDIFTFSRMMSIFGNTAERGFGEQKVLTGWCYLNGWEEMTTHRSWEDEVRTDFNIIEPDCFIHFNGTNKLNRFQRFKAFCLYTKIDRFWEQNVTELKTRGIV